MREPFAVLRGYGEGQSAGLDSFIHLLSDLRMRWIQRVEIIEEEGGVGAPEDLPAAAPSGEGAEATMTEMESAATETLRSGERSQGDGLPAREQEGEGQSGEEAGEEGGMKKEPRLNSLSRWVCNTAGFEVRRKHRPGTHTGLAELI